MVNPMFPLWYRDCVVCGCVLTVLNRSRVRDVCKSCLKRKAVPVSV
jgi:hypothetical protein